jgi:hypothetical protein
MVTFEEMKAMEGNKVIIASKYRSIYIGKITNVNPPEKNDKDHAALADFDYCRFFESATTHGPKKFFMKENSKQFPFWKEDQVYAVTGTENYPDYTELDGKKRAGDIISHMF